MIIEFLKWIGIIIFVDVLLALLYTLVMNFVYSERNVWETVLKVIRKRSYER